MTKGEERSCQELLIDISGVTCQVLGVRLRTGEGGYFQYNQILAIYSYKDSYPTFSALPTPSLLLISSVLTFFVMNEYFYNQMYTCLSCCQKYMVVKLKVIIFSVKKHSFIKLEKQ